MNISKADRPVVQVIRTFDDKHIEAQEKDSRFRAVRIIS